VRRRRRDQGDVDRRRAGHAGLDLMSNFADYDPADVPLSEPAVQVQVFRLSDGGELEELPNVQVLSVHEREGMSPPSAQCRYITDDKALVQGWPTEFEHIYALAYRSTAEA